MRILTVRQPWAWAIIHGGKDVENRVRNLAGDYRGPLAIHAGLQEDEAAWSDPVFMTAWTSASPLGVFYRPLSPMWANFGSIIGVVNLVDVHHWSECLNGVFGCSPWAQSDAYHLKLASPRALVSPLSFRGSLGLRTLDEATTRHIEAEVCS